MYPIISKIVENGKEHNVHIVPLAHIEKSEVPEPHPELIAYIKEGIVDPIVLERKEGKLTPLYDSIIVEAARKSGAKCIKAVIV